MLDRHNWSNLDYQSVSMHVRRVHNDKSYECCKVLYDKDNDNLFVDSMDDRMFALVILWLTWRLFDWDEGSVDDLVQIIIVFVFWLIFVFGVVDVDVVVGQEVVNNGVVIVFQDVD